MRINTLSFPFINQNHIQTKTSILVRTAAIATGIFLLLMGILVLYNLSGMQSIGTISGWTCVATGFTSFLLGVFLKQYAKDDANFGTDLGTFAVLPSEILELTLDLLEIPDLLRLKKTSKAMCGNVERYLSHKFPIESTKLANHSCQAIEIETIKDEEIKNLILELCEYEDSPWYYRTKKLSYERLKEILEILKAKNLLYLLNTIPVDHFHKERESWDTIHSVLSPLQHWAFKGRLNYVKLLVEYGAKDYLLYSPFGNRSALYKSAQRGHVKVVNYLLENGANADISFESDALRSFIPDFIFHVRYVGGLEKSSNEFKCFKRILDYSALYHPESLSFQLTIPIAEGENAIEWTKEHRRYHPYLQEIYETLKSYKTKGVISVPKGSRCLDDTESVDK